MFSKIIIIVLFSFLLTFAGKSEEKIAFVDLNLIFTNSNAGKKMNNEILNKDKKLKSYKRLYLFSKCYGCYW